MKTLLKAVPYLRVSKGDLSRQKSLEDQLDEARQFASDEGLEIVAGMSYVDDGISGRSVAARPALKQLLEDAQSGRLKAAGVSVVLCWGVDRLGRNMREAMNVVHALKQCGIELMTVRERCNTSDPSESKMTFAIEALIAESYSETLGHLARRAHKDAALKGRFWAPTAPYGYRKAKGGIVIDPKEAALVREVFRLFLEGRSRHSIARMFKEEKIAKRGGSLDWCIDEITRMLTSDAVIGVRVYKGVVW
ncbi:MAG: recombinase family protein, partial [Elusimicrobiota bacterium]